MSKRKRIALFAAFICGLICFLRVIGTAGELETESISAGQAVIQFGIGLAGMGLSSVVIRMLEREV